VFRLESAGIAAPVPVRAGVAAPPSP
jgi:hypothetical protein